jgi:hypothetical protein
MDIDGCCRSVNYFPLASSGIMGLIGSAARADVSGSRRYWHPSLNLKGSAIVTIVYSLYSWRGLLITGSVMSEAAGRVSVVGLRRLPFILIGKDGAMYARCFRGIVPFMIGTCLVYAFSSSEELSFRGSPSWHVGDVCLSLFGGNERLRCLALLR